MYINKLHLRAFGKFMYKRIYFENKFNIIYGENEAGKSTVHNFIEAMLYGFDDENDLVRYNKYKPWNGNLYKGSLGIKDNLEEKYLIARDFLLGTSQVYKKESNEPEMHEETIENSGEYFFNMNKVSFNNTVSVRQLGNKTEQELVTELKNKIINLSKTRDESISIDRILQRLSNIKEEAGDETNDKTLLGQYSLRLSELQSARENSVNAKRQVMFLAMEKKKVKSKIQELNLRIDELNKELKEYEQSVEKDKYLRAEPIKNELDDIIEKLSHFSEENVKKYSDIDYKEALKIENVLYSMYNEKRTLENEKANKEEELNSLLADISNKITEQFNIEKLNQDYRKYESNISKIKDLEKKIETGKENIKNINIKEIDLFLENYSKYEDINRQIQMVNVLLDKDNYEKMKSFRASKTGNVILIVLISAALIGGVWWSSYEYNNLIKNFIDQYYVLNESVNIAAGIVTALIIIILSLTLKPLFNKIKGAKNEIDSLECEFADHTLFLEKLNNEKQEIIKETGCESFDDIALKYNNISKEKSLYEEKNKLINYDIESLNTFEKENDDLKSNILRSISLLDIGTINEESIKEANDAYSRKDFVKKQIETLKGNVENLNQTISKIDKEISFEEKRLNMILINNGMEDLESFKKSVSYSEKYTELKNNKDYKESILTKILGDESFEDLKNKTKNVNFYEIKKLDKQSHQLNIYKLEQEKTTLTESINNILKEIDEIEHSTRNLAEIEEEIDFYENKINGFKRKIKVAEVASERIVKISNSIKGDFMPLLRKSISDNFAYLTSGKYSEVVIDEDMNITVVEEDNKDRHIELESLSGGTLDQLYLSLRVGLGNIISGNKNIPLIFDDSFVQYDSKRLKNSIEMLAKESERRQIILFTCQEREAELAKQMNIKFNFIKL